MTDAATLPPMTAVQSEAVARIGWLPLAGASSGTVFITWRGARGEPTGTYAYAGVSLFDWNQLRNAGSKGRAANLIKRRHTGERVA